MSIKHGLLALLKNGPAYGYQLRTAFEESTGSNWPLNIGQVYTTLSRLERDDLVEALPESDQGQRPYRITNHGETALAAWFSTPVTANDRARDELAIKLSLALATAHIDISAIVQTQRTATIQSIQEYTRLKRQAAKDDIAWLLVIDSMIFRAEAEVRWLDHCETSLLRHNANHPPTPHPQTNSGADSHSSMPTRTHTP